MGGASQAPSPERVREAVEAIPEEGGTMEHDQEGGGGGGGGVGYDGATATQSAPLLGPVDGGSRHGSLDSAANSRNREIQIKDEIPEFPSTKSKKIVVRTSQSGLIPDTPGPLPEISGLIPDSSDIDPTFQTIFSNPQNRTSKSGLLVQNRTSRSGLFEDLPGSE